MFDYYKSWDKFTKEATEKEGSDGEEDPDFIPAQNPKPEEVKPPQS